MARRMTEMTDNERIYKCEERYNKFLASCVSAISSDLSVQLLLVAGPSCSGKTTTTSKLIEGLAKSGRNAFMISIDDFYKKAADMPKKPDGQPDFEALESFDLDTLHKCLSRLVNREAASIPRFDFQKSKRYDNDRTISLGENGIAVVEGLHALNPVLYKNYVDSSKVYRVFLDCHTDTMSSMRYSRFMRRLVRDYHYRNSDAEKTFYLWENVLEGEKKYIYPFEKYADVKINTRFDYEPNVFRNSVLDILSKLPEKSKYAPSAEEIIDYLSVLEPIDEKLVPQDSLLREFL